MKWLVLVMCLLCVGCEQRVEPKGFLPNIHCGEGILTMSPKENTITTPDGRIFEILDVQRSPTTGNVKGSYSYNPNSEQLFCFQDVEPYYDQMFEQTISRDIIPSVIFRVKLKEAK